MGGVVNNLNQTEFLSTAVPRVDLKTAFLTENNLNEHDFDLLEGDASFRRYSRYQGQEKTTIPLLLMDSPAKHEPVSVFANLAEFLFTQDVRTPRIYARDDANGFLLLEDLGRETFTQAIARGINADLLMKTALDSLVVAHDNSGMLSAPTREYTVPVFIEETGRIIFWYWPLAKKESCPDQAKKEYIKAWQDVFANMPRADIGFVHRDFHLDNMMYVEQETGHHKCGWIDFQDGLIGPIAYDLGTLIYNERRDMSDADRAYFLDYYFETRKESVDKDSLMRWLPVMVAQRQSKVLGLFYRLLVRDNKGMYLKHQKRVAGLLDWALQSPDLQPVKNWWDKYLGTPQELNVADDKEIPMLRAMALDDNLNIS